MVLFGSFLIIIDPLWLCITSLLLILILISSIVIMCMRTCEYFLWCSICFLSLIMLSPKKMNINWSEYWKLFNFLHFLPIGKSIDEKSKKDTFDGSRKVINAAMDRICEYTGKSLQPYLLSCKSNFFDYCIGLIFNLQELKSSSGIWECLLWTTYINPVSQALGWMYL